MNKNTNSEHGSNDDKEQLISLLQQKIRTQAKRLCSLQDYIALCESHLSKYNPNLQFPLTPSTPFKHDAYVGSSCNGDIIALENENKRLKLEKQNLIASLKQEMTTNDEQRNYIEILKQTIETSLIKSGLKEKLDYIKSKYYNEYSNNDDYSKIILDITNMKTKNDSLTNKLNEYTQQIEVNNNHIEDLSSQIEQLNNVNTENTNLQNKCNELQTQNEQLQNEITTLKQTITSNEDNLRSITQQLQNAQNENEKIINDNKDIQTKYSNTLNENSQLKEYINNISSQCNQLHNEVISLKQYESRYHLMNKEINDIKNINLSLSHDNNILQHENGTLKKNIFDLTALRNNNVALQNDINILTDKLNVTLSAKAKNEMELKHSIDILQKEKLFIESLLCEKGNCDSQRGEVFNKELQILKDTNVKWRKECAFYMTIIERLLRYHVGCLNVRNIVLQLMELNDKKKEIEERIEQYKNNINVNEKDVEKEIEGKMEMDGITQKMCNLDMQLKQIEMKYRQ
jgi:predicted  nucleic acid-binding Zn-ribbon protein